MANAGGTAKVNRKEKEGPMRRRRSSFRKEKAIMLASSCLVLTALTVTGLYVRNMGKEEEPEENVVDFTALEDEEESLTMLGSQTGEQEEGQAVEDVDAPEGAALDGATQDEQVVEDGNSAQNQAGEGADGADPGADNAAAGEAALTDEARLDGAQQDNLPQEEEALAEAEEEALAANASDAIAKSEQAGEEDADAMSASTLLDFTDSDTPGVAHCGKCARELQHGQDRLFCHPGSV